MCYVTGSQYNTLTTGTATTVTVALPFAPNMEESLTQVEVSVAESLVDTNTTEQFLYAEVYLVRSANSERVLIDRGMVVGGFGQRNMVGMVGRVGYADGDYLLVNLKNVSLASVTYNLSAAYETWPSGEDAYKGNCQGMSRLSKPVHVYYQARRTATQANGAGGQMTIDVTAGTGQALKLVALQGLAGGGAGHTVTIALVDEDNAQTVALGTVSAGSGVKVNLPSVGSVYTTIHSQGLIILNGAKISVYNGEAGAQNDTLTVACVFELLGNYSEPTWDKSRSTNPGDVTLASNTISAANVFHVVVE